MPESVSDISRVSESSRRRTGVDGGFEELINSLTHAVGLVFSIPALIFLVVYAAMREDPSYLLGASIFGVAMVLMYAASVLYHSVPEPRLKRLLRTLDHIAIYVLIAGTYTPFMLVSLGDGWGWTMLCVVWGMALAGTVFKLFFTGRYPIFSTVLYLVMGWLAVLVAGPLMESMHLDGLLWLAAGGALYSLGVVFFAWESLPYNHAIWHLFVVGGTVCHYLAVLLYA